MTCHASRDSIVGNLIKSFNCKETEKIFNKQKSKKFPSSIHRTALRKLTIINNAFDLRDIRQLPGNYYEELKQYNNKSSIRINDQYRILFFWNGTDAFEVEIVDYH